jgi:uncharacterized membrane protein
VPALDKLRDELYVNVSEHERLYSVIGGVAAILSGLSQRSFSGALLALAGGALVMRGTSGHCPLYVALEKSALVPAVAKVQD